MKKHYASLIIFLCLTTFMHSQNFTGNWNVISLESGGNTVSLPSTVTTPPNINFDDSYSSPPAGYDQYWGRYIHGYGICNSFTTYYETYPESIDLIPYFEPTNNTCSTTLETSFETQLFSILQVQGDLTYLFYNNLHNLSIINVFGEAINLEREDAPTNLLSGEWFIHSIWDYDILLENTFNPNLNIIFSDDSVNGQSVFYGSSTCNGFNGSYDNPIQTNSFIKRNIGWTLIECNSTEEMGFENSYMLFFENFNEDIYTFEITGSGSDATLIIRNGYGSEINYGRQALSVDNFKKQSTKLITNLEENKLQLISDSILADAQYSIFDVSGRLILSARLNDSKNIPTSILISGVYVLNIQNSKHVTERFKFLKK